MTTTASPPRAFTDIGTVVSLELAQRVRSTAWYVLLGVFAVLMLGITALLLPISSLRNQGGGYAFSTIVFFVLLLGTLITPALSGGSVNGDREAGTLATTQVTLVRTGALLLGKVLAAWVSSLALVVIALPFLAVAVIAGGLRIDTVLVSVLIVAIELGIVAGIGVGLSALITRTVFSVVVTYLIVAALSLGTLLVFALGGLALQTDQVVHSRSLQDTTSSDASKTPVCGPFEDTHQAVPRFDLVWWSLSANPYVVLADAVPGSFDKNGEPKDLFGGIASGARFAQIAPKPVVTYDDCSTASTNGPTPAQIMARTIPSWFAGLGLHLLLTAAILLGAWRALLTPTRKLPRGSRVA
ncbi:MAG TPA: ABC transporter permease [Amnibacterium sp.]|jgi:ABC-type transport system involved in multi-copper enzyme maturation permease subunit|uniref:ABC transporter permease n=1 Tax=Amnibacterium sp. TaxID=1872496 RepID=UPI002F95F169